MQQEDLFPDFIEFPLIQDDDIPGIRCSEGDNGEIGTSDRGSGAIGHLDEACELSGQLQTLPFPTGLSKDWAEIVLPRNLLTDFKEIFNDPEFYTTSCPSSIGNKLLKLWNSAKEEYADKKESSSPLTTESQDSNIYTSSTTAPEQVEVADVLLPKASNSEDVLNHRLEFNT